MQIHTPRRTLVKLSAGGMLSLFAMSALVLALTAITVAPVAPNAAALTPSKVQEKTCTFGPTGANTWACWFDHDVTSGDIIVASVMAWDSSGFGYSEPFSPACVMGDNNSDVWPTQAGFYNPATIGGLWAWTAVAASTTGANITANDGPSCGYGSAVFGQITLLEVANVNYIYTSWSNSGFKLSSFSSPAVASSVKVAGWIPQSDPSFVISSVVANQSLTEAAGYTLQAENNIGTSSWGPNPSQAIYAAVETDLNSGTNEKSAWTYSSGHVLYVEDSIAFGNNPPSVTPVQTPSYATCLNSTGGGTGSSYPCSDVLAHTPTLGDYILTGVAGYSNNCLDMDCASPFLTISDTYSLGFVSLLTSVPYFTSGASGSCWNPNDMTEGSCTWLAFAQIGYIYVTDVNIADFTTDGVGFTVSDGSGSTFNMTVFTVEVSGLDLNYGPNSSSTHDPVVWSDGGGISGAQCGYCTFAAQPAYSQNGGQTPGNNDTGFGFSISSWSDRQTSSYDGGNSSSYTQFGDMDTGRYGDLGQYATLVPFTFNSPYNVNAITEFTSNQCGQFCIGAGILVNIPLQAQAPPSTVTQPITLTLAEAGAPTGTFAISGCSVTPTSVVGDGSAHDVTATPSCSLTVTVPADGGNSRYRISGSTSVSFNTCTGPSTCSDEAISYEYEVENTFQITAFNVADLDAGLTASFTSSLNPCSISATSGASGTASCTGYSYYGVAVTAPRFLTGPGANIDWQNIAGSSSTIGTPTSAGNTFNTNYSKQLQEEFDYAIVGGGAGYTAPSLTCTYLGSSTDCGTLTTSPAVFDIDVGGTWSVPNPLTGSSGTERWDTNGATTGSVSAGGSVTFTYYHQFNPTYQITATATAKFPFGTHPTLTITGFQFGSGVNLCTITTTYATTDTCQGWTDSGTTVTVAKFLSGAASSTQWQNAAGAATTDNVNSAATVNTAYYEQLAQTYAFDPSSPSTWNGATTEPTKGTYLGTGATTICTATLNSGGGSASCSGYADNNTAVTFPNTITIGSVVWTGLGTKSFTQTTAGNTDTVIYDSWVEVPVTITVPHSAPTGTFTLTLGLGCSSSPSTIPSDGSPHDLNVTEGCLVGIDTPADGAYTRYRLYQGGGPLTEVIFNACTPGGSLCSGESYDAFYQDNNTYSANSHSPATWPQTYTISVVGVFDGVGPTGVAVINAVSGQASGSVSVWTDYDAEVSLAVSSTVSNSRVIPINTHDWLVTTGHNTFSTNFIEQVENYYYGTTSQVVGSAIQTISITGTVNGTAGTTICSLTTTIGKIYEWSYLTGVASTHGMRCIGFADAGIATTFPSVYGANASNRWATDQTVSFTRSTGGNDNNVTYWEQQYGDFAISPLTPNTFDATLHFPQESLQFGAWTTVCTVTVHSGSGLTACNAWFDSAGNLGDFTLDSFLRTPSGVQDGSYHQWQVALTNFSIPGPTPADNSSLYTYDQHQLLGSAFSVNQTVIQVGGFAGNTTNANRITWVYYQSTRLISVIQTASNTCSALKCSVTLPRDPLPGDILVVEWTYSLACSSTLGPGHLCGVSSNFVQVVNDSQNNQIFTGYNFYIANQPIVASGGSYYANAGVYDMQIQSITASDTITFYTGYPGTPYPYYGVTTTSNPITSVRVLEIQGSFSEWPQWLVGSPRAPAYDNMAGFDVYVGSGTITHGSDNYTSIGCSGVVHTGCGIYQMNTNEFYGPIITETGGPFVGFAMVLYPTYLSDPAVTVPIQLTNADAGAPTNGVFPVTGCGAIPGSVLGNGTTQDVVAANLCDLTINTPADGSNTRERFSGDNTSLVFETCSTGTCDLQSHDYYYQLQNEYIADPIAPATYDNALSIPATGTVAGQASQTLCTISTTHGAGSEDCLGWTDYNTAASLPASVADGSQTEWNVKGTHSWTQTTPANDNTADYYLQIQGTYIAATSPSSQVLYACSNGGTQGSGSGGGKSFLYTINPTTGAYIENFTVGMGIWGCSGLAYNPITNILYAVGQTTHNGEEWLFTVNTATGVATGVGEVNATSHPYHLTNISFKPGTSTLYAAFEGNGDAWLFTLNTATGAPTRIGQIQTGISVVGGMMTFSQNGTLYWSNGNGQLEEGLPTINTLNPSTGAITGGFQTDVNVTSACQTSIISYPAFNAGAYNEKGVFYAGLNCYPPNYLVTVNPGTAVTTLVGESVPTLNGLAFVDTTTAWNGTLTLNIVGTSLGVPATVGCTITTANGGYAFQCSAYFDYDTQIAFPSSTGHWNANGTREFTDTIPSVHIVFYTLSMLTTVIQGIKVTMSMGASAVLVTITGSCAPTNSTFLSNGYTHLETMHASCNFGLSFTNSGTSRDGFVVLSVFSATSPTEETCASGTCTTLSLTGYLQYLIGPILVAYGTTTPINPAPSAFTLTCTQVGAVTSGCATDWADYETPAFAPSVTWAGIQVGDSANATTVKTAGPTDIQTYVYMSTNGIQLGANDQSMSEVSWNANLLQLSYTTDCTATNECIINPLYPSSGVPQPSPYYVLTNGQGPVVEGAGWNWDGNYVNVVIDYANALTNYIVSWAPYSSGCSGCGVGGVVTTTTHSSSNTIQTSSASSSPPATNETKKNPLAINPLAPLLSTFPGFILGLDLILFLAGLLGFLFLGGSSARRKEGWPAYIIIVIGAYIFIDSINWLLGFAPQINVYLGFPLLWNFSIVLTPLADWLLSLGALGAEVAVTLILLVIGLSPYAAPYAFDAIEANM